MLNGSKLLSSFIFLISVLVGCSDNDSSPTTAGEENNFSTILADYADHVVVATYADLKNNAIELNSAVTELKNNPTQENLKKAAESWKSTRAPWESSEAFLFGPVSFLGLDPSLDSWPLDQAQLNEVLTSDFELTPEFISEGLGFSLRGFHTIEFLIFRDGSPRDVSTLTEREFEYLISASEVLKKDAATLYDEWAGGFRDEYVSAGGTGSRYISEVQAVQEIIEGIIEIADEVGNGKISDPYSTKDVLTVESWFSWNSLTDFENNMRSIQNAYVGGYHNGSDGVGLDEFVNSKNAELDSKIKAEIADAISKISAIPHPFRNNLNSSAEIEAAIKACNQIVATFENDVKPLVNE